VYTKTPAARTANAQKNKKGNPGCAVIVFLIILLANVAPRIFEGIKDAFTDDSTYGFSSSAPAIPDSDESVYENDLEDPRDGDYFGAFGPSDTDTLESFPVVVHPETGFLIPDEHSSYPPDLEFIYLEDEHVIEDIAYGIQFDNFGAVNLDSPDMIWDPESWSYEHSLTGYRFSMLGFWEGY